VAASSKLNALQTPRHRLHIHTSPLSLSDISFISPSPRSPSISLSLCKKNERKKERKKEKKKESKKRRTNETQTVERNETNRRSQLLILEKKECALTSFSS
jgi:hypothetical protein